MKEVNKLIKMQMAVRKDRLVLRLKGELDQSNVMLVKKRTMETMERFHIKNLVLNFKELSFMDSSGIGFIIGRTTELRKQNGEIVIVQMNETIKKIFNVSGLKRLCKVCENEEFADIYLGVQSIGGLVS